METWVTAPHADEFSYSYGLYVRVLCASTRMVSMDKAVESGEW